MSLSPAHFPVSWQSVIGEEFGKPYFTQLLHFVAKERKAHTVYPPEEDVYSAFALTPYAQTRVLILGQDPYHDANQAHGLCFSVKPGVRPPPSLVNIFKELHSDLGCRIPNNGHLTPWAKQGVLLLNAVLTVRAHSPNSHKGKGWEDFTDTVIQKANESQGPIVFVLWGSYAKKKLNLIDLTRHKVVEGVHPSPLSAHQGFFGSRPFSAINTALRNAGTPEIDWQLPDL